MKIIYFVLIMLLGDISLYAADYRGKVVFSESDENVFGASVQLVDTLNNVYKGDKTNKSGEFVLKNVEYNKYLLKISYVGYKTIEYKYTLNQKSSVNFGEFKLQIDEKVADDVVVEANAILGEMVGDTSQYNAQAIKTTNDAMVNELLQKLPGFKVDADGKVTAQGKEVKEVLVDGKKFFGDDPKTVLENIPANIVDKVQVYDKNDEQTEFSGKEADKDQKAVNIVLQEDKKVGIFGSVNAGVGNEGMYTGAVGLNYMNGDHRLAMLGWLNNNGGNMDWTTASSIFADNGAATMSVMSSTWSNEYVSPEGAPVFSIGADDGRKKIANYGISYANNFAKKVDANIFYMISKSSNENSKVTNRDYFGDEENARRLDQNGNGEIDSWKHIANMNVKIELDSLNKIMFTPDVSYADNDAESYSTTINQYRNGKKINDAETKFYSNSKNTNFTNYLNYTHKSSKEGRRYSASLSQNFSEQDGYSKQNSVINYFLQNRNDTLNQKSDLYSKNSYSRVSLSASEPLSKISTINLDYDFSVQNGEDNRKTNIFDPENSNYSILDTNLSNDYNSKSIKHNVELNYVLKIGEPKSGFFRLSASAKYNADKLTGEQIVPIKYDVEKTVNKFLPSLALRGGPGDGLEFSVRYSYDYQMPSVSDLNEVVNNTNPLNIYRGNRNIKEAKEHSLHFSIDYHSDDYSKSAYIGSYNTWQNDYIGQTYFTALNDTTISDIFLNSGAQLTRPENLDGYFSSYSYLYIDLPLPVDGFNVRNYGNFQYSERPTVINGQNLPTYSRSVSENLTITSKFSKDFSLSVGGHYMYNDNRNPLLDEKVSNTLVGYSLHLDWKFWGGLYFKGDYSASYHSGKYYESGDTDDQQLNFSIGYKFLKNDAFNISLQFYDLLNDAKGISLDYYSGYYSEYTRSTVMPRYIMLNAVWKFNTLGGGGQDMDMEMYEM
ncbi:MAG: TonB-dependent receptor [Candidatus Kapabacteria bacterium]|nr:TonB-dependent receptor [Candidatus Kapabacteria bacterium]